MSYPATELDLEALLQGSPYQAGRFLRRGGFGEVWAVQAIEGGQAAVAKVFSPAQEGRAAAIHERDILTLLPRGIAPRYRWSKADDRGAIVVLDRARGQAMAPGEEDVLVAAALLRCLMRLHDAGVVHGDLKPSHCFFANGEVQLIDFGSSRSAHSAGKSDLTPGFSAPELYEGAVISSASDVYSACASIFWLLAKRPVFEGRDRLLMEAHRSWEAPQLASLCSVSPAVNLAVHRGLAKRPELRPTLNELLEVFEAPDNGTQRRGASAALGAQRRQLLLAFTPGGELGELQAQAQDAGAELLAFSEAAALLRFESGTRPPHERAGEMSRRLNEAGKATRIEERFFPLRRDRRGRERVLIDGTALLEEMCCAMESRSEAQEPGCVPSPLAFAPLFGREQVLDDIVRLLRDVPEGGACVELVASPGAGASRVLQALAERLPQAHIFDGMRVAGLLLVDDAHRLHPDTLRAIRQAVVDGVCSGAVLAFQSLEAAPPKGGYQASRVHLGGLDPDASHALFAFYAPEVEAWTHEQRELLHGWTGGIPALIVEVARVARLGAFVGPRAEGKAAYADLVGLQAGLTAASADWIVDRYSEELRGPIYHVALELCISEQNTLEELLATRWALRSADPRLALDEGLVQLERVGLLRRQADGRVGLRSELLRRALYERVAPAHWRAHHRVRLRHWLRSSPGPLRDQAMAHHGLGCGRLALAVEAYARVAKHCMKGSACAAAERALGRALQHCDAKELSRLQRLRAEVLLRSDRLGEALQAAEMAVASANSAIETSRAYLCRAMILDWMRDYSASAATLQMARLGLSGGLPQDLRAELLLAEGRSAWREGRLRDARRLLVRAGQRGRGLCRRIAALLAPLATLGLKQATRAAEELSLAIEICRDEQDWLHLCAAIGNRSHVWSALGDTESAATELRQLVDLARRTGHAAPERVAAYNLAEDLFWAGHADVEALRLARRARYLYERYEVHSTSIYALLEARILASMGKEGEASTILLGCQPSLEGESRAIADSLSQYLGDSELQAHGLELGQGDEAGEELSEETHLEVSYWRARAAMRRGHMDRALASSQRAHHHLHAAPVFAERLEQLQRSLREVSGL